MTEPTQPSYQDGTPRPDPGASPPPFGPPYPPAAPPAGPYPPGQAYPPAGPYPPAAAYPPGPYPAGPYPPGQPYPGSPYPPGPPPAGRSRRGLVIGLVAGGLTLVLVCAAAVALAVHQFRTRTADPLAGVVDYSDDPFVQDVNHREGEIAYPVTPPVGGPHYQEWQNCTGDVYDAPIENGRAVHSLEHGAVWITYRPDLDAGDVATLRQRVEGGDYIMMSPYPGQPTAVSLQVWGYQLRLDSADPRSIDTFITAYHRTTAPEPQGACSGGSTAPAA